MAKSRQFNRQLSLEAEEVILDEVGLETSGEVKLADPVPFKEPKNVETAVSANSEPTRAELQIAKELSGTPHAFDSEYQSVLESLARYGIAANFGDNWGRGHKWHQFCK